MPEVLKNINKLDKIVNIEEEEQIMALKERQLQLRETSEHSDSDGERNRQASGFIIYLFLHNFL
uniref:Uncharacterized protein n=1 Tax=Rhizophagus irregularis (strain DAOM 181602 / DAOM 197198 / MUCL 43194) TaxID=747089 RepID=U9UT44_RHIID